jgi:hypothetical protein
MYCNVMIQEWTNRGYKNNMKFLPHSDFPEFPWWWGWEPVHKSHQAALNRKLSSHYSFDTGPWQTWGYVWPSKVPPELRLKPVTPEELNLDKIYNA